jgi:hypothetical protein
MGNLTQNGHIEEDLLDRYAMGDLSGDLLPAIEEHLLICTECQSRLRETDEFIAIFTQAVSRIEFRPAPWWKKVLHFRIDPLWIAALAIVILSVPVVRTWNRAQQSPEAEVLMQSLRGPGENAHIAAGKPARLVFDLPSSSGNCKLRILDSNGAAVQETRTSGAGSRPAASIAGLAAGDYWARLYCGSDDELTAEYSLNAN